MEYNDELMMALRACIKHHQMINTFCNKLEDFYSAFNFGKFFQVTILICLLAVTATTGQNSIMKMITISKAITLREVGQL